jgi:rhamnogalacturonyl hydrolase YesR
MRIILQQSVRRFPINIRPFLGIKKETSSKGMGFCALGYLNLYQIKKETKYLEKMQYCLGWLANNYSKGYSGYCWGNHFSYESRAGKIPLGVPTIVWTSLISNAFLDAYEVFGNQEYLDIAKSAGNFILNDIGRYVDSDKAICLMYTPSDKENPSYSSCIHNSNLLAAWFLGHLFKHTKDDRLLSLAKKSINYAIKYQLPTGGWYYGEHKKYHWEDTFHTGYNLDSIHGYKEATGDKAYDKYLIKGFKYFKERFFLNDGTPKYYDYKTYPIDIQCASQGILTLVKLKEYDPDALDLARRVAIWTLNNMQDRKGYFYFRKYPFITNKTPMFHWGQGTMLGALAYLLRALESGSHNI